MTDEEVVAASRRYTVFGRVNPEQKALLIKQFKLDGKTVAMTGDGVNDILAMKEADCAVAMGAGSQASKSVAHLVLFDSKFSSMPSVVAEGRRVVNKHTKLIKPVSDENDDDHIHHASHDLSGQGISFRAAQSVSD